MGKGTCNQDWRIYPWTGNISKYEIFRCMHVRMYVVPGRDSTTPVVMVISKSPLLGEIT
jgi:hypothetical protein